MAVQLDSNIKFATARNQDGRLEIFARGADRALWHIWQVAPNGAWSGWQSLGGELTSNPAVGQHLVGRLSVFVRGTNGGARLQHDRNNASHIKRRLAREQIAQRATFQQLHHDVEIAVGGRAKVGDADGVRVMHSAGGARFAAETLLCRTVPDESLT